MAKKKTSRKDLLKGPDEFLTFSGKALHFFTTHQRELQYVGLGICAVILLYLAIQTYMGYIDRKGQTAYNEAYYALDEIDTIDPGVEELEKPKELFAKVIDEYSMSDVAPLALPQIARIDLREKDYDEAIAHYRKFLDQVTGDAEYESLARLALAACHEFQGDFKAAIGVLKPVVTQSANPFRESAMLSLARLYRLDKQPEKEKETLEKFVSDYKGSPFLPMAKALLS
jgi:tetratricopeptide (TPR) repeat protein